MQEHGAKKKKKEQEIESCHEHGGEKHRQECFYFPIEATQSYLQETVW